MYIAHNSREERLNNIVTHEFHYCSLSAYVAVGHFGTVDKLLLHHARRLCIGRRRIERLVASACLSVCLLVLAVRAVGLDEKRLGLSAPNSVRPIDHGKISACTESEVKRSNVKG